MDSTHEHFNDSKHIDRKIWFFFALDLSATKFQTSNLQNLAVQSAKTCYYSIRVTANTYYLIETSAENLLFAKGIFLQQTRR